MKILVPVVGVSPLRQRLVDEMEIRRFDRDTQRNYIRDVGRFATFLGRSPDTATAEEVRRFQVEQRDLGVPVPTMNSMVSALRFFFTQALDRPDLARKLVRTSYERKLPVVLSQDEVARLFASCSGSHGPPSPIYQPNQTIFGRHARAAAGRWSSSRPSNANADPARRRLLQSGRAVIHQSFGRRQAYESLGGPNPRATRAVLW